MRLLKNRYLCEIPRDPVKETNGQLVLFEKEDADHRRFKKVRVINVAPEEEKIKVGDILTIHSTAGEAVNLEGDRVLFVKRKEVIYWE